MNNPHGLAEREIAAVLNARARALVDVASVLRRSGDHGAARELDELAEACEEIRDMLNRKTIPEFIADAKIRRALGLGM